MKLGSANLRVEEKVKSASHRVKLFLTPVFPPALWHPTSTAAASIPQHLIQLQPLPSPSPTPKHGRRHKRLQSPSLLQGYPSGSSPRRNLTTNPRPNTSQNLRGLLRTQKRKCPSGGFRPEHRRQYTGNTEDKRCGEDGAFTGFQAGAYVSLCAGEFVDRHGWCFWDWGGESYLGVYVLLLTPVYSGA